MGNAVNPAHGCPRQESYRKRRRTSRGGVAHPTPLTEAPFRSRLNMSICCPMTALAPPGGLTRMTPQRLGRNLLLVLLGLVGCALLVLALLPYLVSLDSVKGQIVGHLEAALGRRVDVGAVRLQVLSGLGAGLE